MIKIVSGNVFTRLSDDKTWGLYARKITMFGGRLKCSKSDSTEMFAIPVEVKDYEATGEVNRGERTILQRHPLA